jgi:hypothetical protein
MTCQLNRQIQEDTTYQVLVEEHHFNCHQATYKVNRPIPLGELPQQINRILHRDRTQTIS